MASTALGIVGTVAGTAIGGPLGGAIGGYVGALVGGLIDNMLFAGQQKVEGPRIDDLTVSASSYGQPIPLLYGPQNRLAGNMIDKTDIRETATTEESGGGKGGPTVSTTTYSYDIPVLAFALGEGPVNRLKRIWANGKLIFDLDAASTPPGAATALVGMVATRANGTHAVFDTVRFYQGNDTQQIDPSLESIHGVGNTPAYKFTSYCVLTNFQLADFGNAPPNFEFELEAHESILVSNVCVDICARAGIPLASSGGLAIPLKGYVVTRPGTAVAALEPLALVYGFDIAEQRGQIRFVQRGRGMRLTIPLGDMGAVAGGTLDGERPEPVKFDRMDDVLLPSEAVLTFFDPARDYEVNSMPSFRNLGSSENKLSHEVSMTLDADEGRAVADRLLWEAWFARSKARFAVTDKYHKINAGDIIGVPVGGSVVPFKIERGTRGANGVIDIEARYEDPEVYRPVVPGDSGEFNPSLLELPGETVFQPLDMPIVRDVDDNTGFYWSVNAESTGWRGVELKRSIDGGVTYFNMARTSVRAVTGVVAAALPSGPTRFWDRANVITVVLDREFDALESISEELVLAGRNGVWLGGADGQEGEVLQFATATLVAPQTYELSDLLRGRLGTEHAVGAHGTNERFVLLNVNTLKRSVFGAADWNKQRHYKPVSVLTEETGTTAQTFTNTGEGKRPYAPVHVRGERDSSNNLTITWRRRSRILAPGLGNGPVALGEETESYEIDIFDGADVVRTIAASSETASYTAAQQTADGLTPGDPVTMRVYQLSTIRGRGRHKEAVV